MQNTSDANILSSSAAKEPPYVGSASTCKSAIPLLNRSTTRPSSWCTFCFRNNGIAESSGYGGGAGNLTRNDIRHLAVLPLATFFLAIVVLATLALVTVIHPRLLCSWTESSKIQHVKADTGVTFVCPQLVLATFSSLLYVVFSTLTLAENQCTSSPRYFCLRYFNPR